MVHCDTNRMGNQHAIPRMLTFRETTTTFIEVAMPAAFLVSDSGKLKNDVTGIPTLNDPTLQPLAGPQPALWGEIV